MKFWKIYIAILLISACKCNSGKDKSSASDTTLVIPDTLLVYEVDVQDKILQKHTEIPDSAFTVNRVINGLNQKYPNVQLQFAKQSNDTLYVTVPKSEYLGERMGSTGSASWYADAVLNLTAVAGINYVNIQLKEGSHASPGVFSKDNYKDYRQDSIPH